MREREIEGILKKSKKKKRNVLPKGRKTKFHG